MRLVRFLDSVNQIHFGDDQGDGTALRIQGDPLANFTVTHQKIAIYKRLAPIQPAAILCIGLNYLKHMEELGSARPEFPMLFMKNPAALQNPGDPIQIPTHLKSDQVDWECELAIVIGKHCKNVSKDNALDYVLGYTAANDVSAGDWQKKWGGGQFCRGKSFLTPSCPRPRSSCARSDPGSKTSCVSRPFCKCGLHGWDSNTRDMIFDVPTLIAFTFRLNNVITRDGDSHFGTRFGRGPGHETAAISEAGGLDQAGRRRDRRAGESGGCRIKAKKQGTLMGLPSKFPCGSRYRVGISDWM